MNWIISELFFPDEVSTAKILTEIALRKVEYMPVNVICGPSGYENTYEIQKNNLDKRIIIYRIALPNLNKNDLFQRIIRLLIMTSKMGWTIFRKVKKDDNVLITTNPAFLIPIVAIMSRVLKFRLEILVHDVFPENLIPAGLLKKNSIRYNVLSWIYRISYQQADRVIVLGRDMKELLKQKIGQKAVKIDIIPNWSEEYIYPIHNFDFQNYLSFDISGKIVLGFAGNLGRVQGVLEFIDLFNRSKNPNICLVIIGDGALKPLIQNKIINENIQNIYYLGPKPRAEQNLFLNSCHLGVITLIQGMKGLGVPSKAYNLMAAGKPFLYIGDKESEIDTYIRKYDCGWSFSWEQELDILTFLKSISKEQIDCFLQKGLKSRMASKDYEKEYILSLF